MDSARRFPRHFGDNILVTVLLKSKLRWFSGGSAVLEVCDLPPVLQRRELDSYLNDLTVFGARRFLVHDDLEVTPAGSKDMTCVGSAAAVVAVFDSAASAQRALHEHCGGKRYRLQATSRTFDPSQPQRS